MITTFLLLLSSGVHFTEVSREVGLEFQHRGGGSAKDHILETVGSGVGWIDYDQDGWLDLYAVNGGLWEELGTGNRSVSNALFRNQGDGTFRDVTREAGVGGRHWGMGVTVADYDNDGWPDLYVCNYGPNVLYRNNGDGSFRDVTRKAGVGDPSWSSSAAFADANGDGWLDLYVANYVEFDHENPPAASPDCQYRGVQVHCGPVGLPAARDTFYLSNGDGTFRPATKAAGMDAPASYGMGAAWCDYDGDGDGDLYVANDSMANFLFRNRGDGTFQEWGLASGVAFNEDGQAQAGMGVAFGDYDRDERFDLYVTNFSADYNTLYRNLGGSLFRDVTRGTGLSLPSLRFLGWSTHFLDYDNDGWEDLFVANGHVFPQVDTRPVGTRFRQRNQLLRNLGNGRFRDMASDEALGLSQAYSSRGAALADFDNDGDMDVAVSNMDGGLSLYRNDGKKGHWLRLRLEGTESNRSAVGTRVTLTAGGATQIREVRAGSGYQSSDDPRVHFGLGSTTEVQRIEVRWSRGRRQILENLEANREYVLEEGGKERRFPNRRLPEQP